MVTIETEEKEERIIVKLKGKATVDNILGLKDSFLGLLKNLNKNIIEVSTQDLTQVDISFIQLLASLCRAFVQKNILLQFQDPIQAKILKMIELLGYRMYNHCLVNFDSQCILKEIIENNREKSTHE